MGDVSSSNDWPGSTSRSVMLCVPPALVVISPRAPLTNGPSIATDTTSGFQLGQVLTSDQMLQTRSGLALEWKVLPCDAICASSVRSRPPSAGGPSLGTNGGGMDRHDDSDGRYRAWFVSCSSSSRTDATASYPASRWARTLRTRFTGTGRLAAFAWPSASPNSVHACSISPTWA